MAEAWARGDETVTLQDVTDAGTNSDRYGYSVYGDSAAKFAAFAASYAAWTAYNYSVGATNTVKNYCVAYGAWSSRWGPDKTEAAYAAWPAHVAGYAALYAAYAAEEHGYSKKAHLLVRSQCADIVRRYFPERPVKKVELEYQEAMRLYNIKDYDGALKNADVIIQACPRHWQAWLLAGNCHHGKGNKYMARRSYRTSLDINPNNSKLKAWIEHIAISDPAYQEAVHLYKVKDYDGALRKAAAIYQDDPQHRDWRVESLKGNCLYMKGDADGALVYYRYSLLINPNNPKLKAWIEQVSNEKQR